MDPRERITFRIDSYTPETLPMARLAQYLAHLAEMYGSQDRVHFEKLRKGSAIVQVIVDEPAVPKVISRIMNAKSHDPEQDVKKAYKAIDTLLRQDNAVGTISRPDAGKILEFPGRKVPVPESFSMTQPTSVDGVVIKIGGRDDTIPVTLRDMEGRIVNCQVRGVDKAKELAGHYQASTLRVHGIGKWIRYSTGLWELDSLTIQSFEQLDDAPLDEVLKELTDVRGNGWNEAENPMDGWRKLRGLN